MDEVSNQSEVISTRSTPPKSPPPADPGHNRVSLSSSPKAAVCLPFVIILHRVPKCLCCPLPCALPSPLYYGTLSFDAVIPFLYLFTPPILPFPSVSPFEQYFLCRHPLDPKNPYFVVS